MKLTFPDPTSYVSLLDLAERSSAAHPTATMLALARDDGTTEEWTGQDVDRRARAAAWRIRALGMQPGDRLLAWSPPGPSMPALYLGALRARVLLVPLDLRMSPETIQRIVGLADSAWLALGTGRDAPDPREVDIGAVQLRTMDWFTAEPGEAHDPADVPFPSDWQAQLEGWPRPTRESDFIIIFTSGTTGNPKGAVISNGNVLGTIEAADRVIPHQVHRIVSLLPLSHLFGVVELFYGLHGGAPILYVRSRNPRVIFEAIRHHRVTTMVVVPQVLDLFWTALAREVDRRRQRAAFDRLRAVARHLPYGLRRGLFKSVHAQLGGGLNLFLCAAAFLPPELQQDWEDLGVVVMQGYGSSECGFATANNPGEHVPGTVGRPMPPVRVRLDPTSGEIQVAGPTVFKGYWRNQEATRAAFTSDGWYRSGDVGHWDERGCLVLSGRIKDMIALPSGLKVYPEDIENALRIAGLRDTVVLETKPGRIEAVVVPPDQPVLPQGGAIPQAQPRTAEEATAMHERIDEAVKAANATLGIHQRVVAWRLWPDADFPRTHTLKVKRELVRGWIAADNPIAVREQAEAPGPVSG
ncbi:MAG: AMP-binding protein [Candidatus Limnocylindrales bacterium]